MQLAGGPNLALDVTAHAGKDAANVKAHGTRAGLISRCVGVGPVSVEQKVRVEKVRH